MESAYSVTYTVLAVLLTVFDVYCACLSFRKNEPIGFYLGLSGLFGAIVTFSYLISVRTVSYLNMSVASSIYFACIDWMLVALVRFVYLFTQSHLQKSAQIIRSGLIALAAADSIIMIVNIFTEIAIGYKREGDQIAAYTYQMKPLYIAHLIFTYLIVIFVLVILIHKCFKTPQQYRNQYVLVIAAIAGVVLINAVFLYCRNNSILSQMDWSVFGYSFALALCYWSAFTFRRVNMPKALSMTIFQNIDQGIVLFDHEGLLIMHNKRAEQLLRDIEFRKGTKVSAFLESCEITVPEDDGDRFSVQCELRGTQHQLLRCDYRRLLNSRGASIGNLFVFTDVTNDTDIITGFPYSEAFKRDLAENPYRYPHPSTAVVFDIIGLGEANRNFGRDVGDQRIRHLARLMRLHLPQNSRCIRGLEAHLVAVCPNKTEQDLLPLIEQIIDETADTVLYGICETSADEDIIEAIETASRSLQVKKLLNPKALHSQSLTSLVRALKETDTDTEAHVRRTQNLGMTLGARIGLSDRQMAELRLLCLLHDIGKIGIPLEILNKPGKLTEQEWTVLHSHSEKGYQIAKSSEDLKGIALMILYHHERWDGKGYPERLSGSEIPILSRIISIVDSYDAMVNNRSYRMGMTAEQAQAEIARCAGTQFDPKLAREFLAMLRENPSIAEGELVGGEEIRSFDEITFGEDQPGSTTSIPFSRYILDTNDVIIEADERFEEITGYSRSEVIGKKLQFDLIPQSSRTHYMVQVHNAFLHSNIAYLEHELQRKDNSVIWVVCLGKRYFDPVAKAFRSEIVIFKSAKPHEKTNA